MSRRDAAELWATRIHDYRASGERAEAWCERHQVSPKQLYYWMAKLKKADQPTPPADRPAWLSLTVEEARGLEATPILIRVGTVAVEVRAGFDPSLLANVVRALKALC